MAEFAVSAPDGGMIGVVGGPDPRRQLEDLGLNVSFADARIALSGQVEVVGDLVVAGRATMDKARSSTAPCSESDSALATIAQAWTAGGPAVLMESQGMFATLVYEQRTGEAHLARDPLGERTAYYCHKADGAVWFSDRLTRLRSLRIVGRELSLEALRDYLIYAYVPGTNTMYQEGREVGPGCTVSLPSGQATTWWSLIERHLPNRSLDQNAAWLRQLLTRAVESRRPAGPVGVYLSGGVDSSAITALLCEDNPTDVHTIAVHFGPDLPNELAFVNQVVAHCRPQHHHEIELTSTDLARALPATMSALDDPIGDPLTVPNLALGLRASEFAPTIFNGEGGDPVFGGPKNQPMLLADLYGAGNDIDQLYLRSYQKCYGDLDRLLTDDVRSALATVTPPEEKIAPFLSRGDMAEFVNRLFAANTRLKGCDHILTKVANLTAAAGLIGRSPLFDRAVVEAAFAIPPAHKLHGTVEKAVLKRAVTDLLPATIIERPKAGMRVPVQAWFRGPLRRQGSKRLLSRNARIAPYLDRQVIKEWTRYDGDPSGRYGRKLWLLLSLEHWLEAHDAG